MHRRSRTLALSLSPFVALWVSLVGVPTPRAFASPPSALPDLAAPARTGETAPKDAAVVIGVEDYTYVPHVPYALRDAEAFETFLLYTRGVPLDRVHMLKDARAYEIEEAVRDAGKSVGAGGTLWVYFAGHGAMEPNGSRRLLLGSDAATDPDAFARFAVAVDDVRTWATAGGGEAMLVVDACYNGGGRTGENVLGGGRRFAVPGYALAPSPSASEWAATAPSELAGPLEAAQHGAFTYFAVGALRGWADGEVDEKRDGNVTAEEAQLYVGRALRTVQTRGQTPQLAAVGAADLILAHGVKERGPDLAAIRDAVDLVGDAMVAAPGSARPSETVSAGATTAKVDVAEVDPANKAVKRLGRVDADPVRSPKVVVEASPPSRTKGARGPDADGDGIGNSDDACPGEPEEYDDFQDEDGCPDPDNDGDGVVDADDACVAEPEDLDGFQDGDGCPDSDNDADGVADSEDGCPDEPGGATGGCPDRDADGVSDGRDRCPEQSKDRREVPSRSDGCPKMVFVTADAIQFLDKVYFDTGRSTIKAQSYSLLDLVAKTLKDNPDLTKVEVACHTDSDGDDAKNLAFSQGRAEEVMNHLINTGRVDASRLSAVGYGETRPIDTNATAEGKGNNRRVEFIIR